MNKHQRKYTLNKHGVYIRAFLISAFWDIHTINSTTKHKFYP